MPEPLKIAVLIGSLRKDSFTRKVAHALVELASKGVRCKIVEIRDLAMYNQDLDETPPETWTKFRAEIADSNAVLITTPEYNRSMPACLKNALDVGSRPQGKSVWTGKPAGVVGVSPYSMGAFGANHHVRQVLVYLNMPAMAQPEAYIAKAGELFDAQGVLKNDDSRKFLGTFMQAFERFVTSLSATRS